MEESDNDSYVGLEVICDEGFQSATTHLVCEVDVDSSGNAVVSAPNPVCEVPSRCDHTCYIAIAVIMAVVLFSLLLILIFLIAYYGWNAPRDYKLEHSMISFTLDPHDPSMPAKDSKPV